MHKHLIDKDGNVVVAHIPKGGSTPSGYTDISKDLQMDEDAVGLSTDLLEVVEVPAVEYVAPVAEHWTDGETTVWDANDIPTLLDENSDPYLDPAFVHVPEVIEVQPVAAFHTLKKKSTADQSLREAKMNMIRIQRTDLLAEADIEINKLEDAAGDSSTWRAHRQALRDVTETYKKVDGDWKVSVDSLDVEAFVWPAKPE